MPANSHCQIIFFSQSVDPTLKRQLKEATENNPAIRREHFAILVQTVEIGIMWVGYWILR